MFDRFSDNTVDHIKAILLLCGILLAFFIYLAKKHQLVGLEKKLNYGLGVAALTSFLAFYNFGFFHFGGGHFHTHDLYHYYMGSKYFKETGYLYLYDATILADEESNNYMAEVREIRDQTSYNIVPRIVAHQTMAKWRGKFTDERWREFKGDLVWFQKQPHNWQWWGGIVGDFGYNPSPVWTMIAGVFSNLIPTSSTLGMWFIAYMDGILALIMFFTIYKAFDSQTALFSMLYWGSTFTFVFSFTGASMLRHDWIVYLVIAICCLKMRKAEAAGLFYALSSGLRIFPVLFGLPVAAGYVMKNLLFQHPSDLATGRQNPLADNGSKFIVAAAACGAAIFLCTLIFVPGHLGSWPEFVAKLKVHKESWNTWNWGFIDIFLWTGEVYDNLPGNWKIIKQVRLDALMPIIICLQVATVMLLIMAARRLEYWESFALGGVLVFLFLNPTKYYLVYLITLVPFYASHLEQLWRARGMAMLFGIMIFMFLLNSFNQTSMLLQFVICLSVYLLYVYTLVAACITNSPKAIEDVR